MNDVRAIFRAEHDQTVTSEIDALAGYIYEYDVYRVDDGGTWLASTEASLRELTLVVFDGAMLAIEGYPAVLWKIVSVRADALHVVALPSATCEQCGTLLHVDDAVEIVTNAPDEFLYLCVPCQRRFAEMLDTASDAIRTLTPREWDALSDFAHAAQRAIGQMAFPHTERKPDVVSRAQPAPANVVTLDEINATIYSAGAAVKIADGISDVPRDLRRAEHEHVLRKLARPVRVADDDDDDELGDNHMESEST
jgi:hypothetical protein